MGAIPYSDEARVYAAGAGMKGILKAVLAPNEEAYMAWAMHPPVEDLQRCKMIKTMLDVYQASKGGVEIVQLEGWENMWESGEIFEIYRRLGL